MRTWNMPLGMFNITENLAESRIHYLKKIIKYAWSWKKRNNDYELHIKVLTYSNCMQKKVPCKFLVGNVYSSSSSYINLLSTIENMVRDLGSCQLTWSKQFANLALFVWLTRDIQQTGTLCEIFNTYPKLKIE